MAMLIANFILQFICRKVFLDHLGDEILGLNSTATNLLQFLNIAELGIGVAVGFSLYRPLFDNDRQRINEIIALQGHLYRRIGTIVTAGAIILSCFFPLIFKKMDLPLWYAYASFGVLLISSLLSYFVNYKEVLLTADQKDYKIMGSYRVCMMLRLIVQLFAVKYSDHPYLWWLILEGGFAIIAAIALNLVIRHTYPYLQRPPLSSRELRRMYPEIVTKIKQIFFHKISTFVLQQTSSLIIFAFSTLIIVTYYNNYMVIVTGLTLLLNALFNSIGAGVGNLVAEGDKTRIIKVFDELYAVRFFLSAGAAIMLFILAPHFISLWIGSKYLLPSSTLFIIVIIFFLNASRSSVDSYINAYGLFQDIWAPITEACLNLGLSVLFGWLWGLNGILSGAGISLILIVFIWKPYFLFRKGLREPVRIYWGIYLRNIAALVAACTVLWITLPFLHISQAADTKDFILLTLEVFAITAISLYLAQLALTAGMPMFTRRIASKLLHR